MTFDLGRSLGLTWASRTARADIVEYSSRLGRASGKPAPTSHVHCWMWAQRSTSPPRTGDALGSDDVPKTDPVRVLVRGRAWCRSRNQDGDGRGPFWYAPSESDVKPTLQASLTALRAYPEVLPFVPSSICAVYYQLLHLPTESFFVCWRRLDFIVAGLRANVHLLIA